MSLLTSSLIDEFTEARKGYIGGSDIAAMLGLSRWKTPRMLYEDKVGAAAPRQLNKAMQRGIQLEPIAASIFADTMPCSMAMGPVSGIVHPRFKHVGCHPDRILHFEDGRRGLLEIKCPDRFVFQKVRDNGADEEYELQTQYNMGVIDADVGYLMYFNADLWDWEIFEIKKDLGQQLDMYEQVQAWWKTHVDARNPPAEVQLPEYGDKQPGIGVLEGDLLDVVRQYADLQAVIDNAESELKLVKTKLLGTVVAPGTWQGHGYKMVFTMMPGRKTLSQSKMKEAGIDPEPFMTEGKPYPQVSVKPVKEEL